MGNAYEDATDADREFANQVDSLTGVVDGQVDRLTEIGQKMQADLMKQFETATRVSVDSISQHMERLMDQFEQRQLRMQQSTVRPPPTMPPPPGYEKPPPPPQERGIDDAIAAVHGRTANFNQAVQFVYSVAQHAGIDKQIDVSAEDLIILYGKSIGVLK